jgi:hypothetical protein
MAILWAMFRHILTRHFPRARLTNLPGKWIQCQANGSNVFPVPRHSLGRDAHMAVVLVTYRGISLIRNTYPPRTTIQGFLAHEKTPTPLGPP